MFHRHPSTILRLYRKETITGNVTDMNRSPKHLVTKRQQDQNIIRSHMTNRTETAVATASKIIENHGWRISAQTVRNRLKAVRLRARRPNNGTCITICDHNRRRRLALARSHLRTTRTVLTNVNQRLRKLLRRRYLAELRPDIVNTWNNLPQRLLQKSINSMRQQQLAVIRANGSNTRFRIAIFDFKGHAI